MRLGTAALALVAASSSTPAPSPSGCVDDASWAWTYGLDITCAWVAESPATRCESTFQDADGVRAAEACGLTCTLSCADDYVPPTAAPSSAPSSWRRRAKRRPRPVRAPAVVRALERRAEPVPRARAVVAADGVADVAPVPAAPAAAPSPRRADAPPTDRPSPAPSTPRPSTPAPSPRPSTPSPTRRPSTRAPSAPPTASRTPAAEMVPADRVAGRRARNVSAPLDDGEIRAFKDALVDVLGAVDDASQAAVVDDLDAAVAEAGGASALTASLRGNGWAAAAAGGRVAALIAATTLAFPATANPTAAPQAQKSDPDAASGKGLVFVLAVVAGVALLAGLVAGLLSATGLAPAPCKVAEAGVRDHHTTQRIPVIGGFDDDASLDVGDGEDDGDGGGRVVTWAYDARLEAHRATVAWPSRPEAVVRTFASPARDGDLGFARGGLHEGEILDLARADAGFAVCPVRTQLKTALVRSRPLLERLDALNAELKVLRIPYDAGRVEISVRRDSLVEDSFLAFGRLPPSRMRQALFVKFQGEEGLDAGGVSREFWLLLWRRFLDADVGLFAFGGGGDADGPVYGLNGDAKVSVDDHLVLFRFAGRCLGKVLFDGHQIDAQFDRILLKHLVGEAVDFDDLRHVDVELWRSLKGLRDLPGDIVDDLALSFSVDNVRFGATETRELLPGGAELAVSADNVDEFLALRLRERALDALRDELAAFLAGFYEVVPVEVLLLLSAADLQRLLAGSQSLDLDDWKRHTKYKGAYEAAGADHAVVAWFWAAVATYDDDRRRRLLQWCTGSNRIPLQGFSHLQSRDGARRAFTITSVDRDQARYPRAHTCFHRVDLPLYEKEADLVAAFDDVLSNEAGIVGFSMD
ncbi:ubiquitin protein ligase [Aureococcus anophagefferens]|uniref:HECT-type E3 ubiquitin transferase n=2 Tax=Aureococcus anophagefferens TaxID=44056 RepID=A0ABR1FIJ4_AURAN